jgi:hypothetical protein
MRTLTVVALLWTTLTLHPETAAAKFVYQPCPDLQVGGVWQIDVYLGNTLNNTQTWNLSQFESAGVGGAAAGAVHCALEGILVSSTNARFPEEGRLDA